MGWILLWVFVVTSLRLTSGNILIRCVTNSKSTLVFLCLKENLCTWVLLVFEPSPHMKTCTWVLLVFEPSPHMKTATSLCSCSIVRRACSLHEFICSFRFLLRCSLASDFVLLDPCLITLSC
jgi:hypothetical protein